MLLNVLAWNNKIGPWYYFVGLRTEVMINRDSWGYSYSIVRGEILGFLEDELLRKHLPRIVVLTINYADKGLVGFRNVSISTLGEIISLWVPGGVWSQG
jgi:hypothetical protein